jgi:hypothetical protein
VVAVARLAWTKRLGYHEIQTDANGQIVSWAAPNPGQAYGRVIVVNFDDVLIVIN